MPKRDPDTISTLALSLIETDWPMPPTLATRYWEARQSALLDGPSATLAALDKLANQDDRPETDELRRRLADARLAAATVTAPHYISAPSTTPGVEGNRHATHQVELRRQVFRLGRDKATVHGDGTVILRFPNDTSTTYRPATREQYDAFCEGNRRKMAGVTELGEKIRAILASAEGLTIASRVRPGTSGVDVHVGGGTIGIFWWLATWEEQLSAGRTPDNPWTEQGGIRDQVAALLLAEGISTRKDRDQLAVDIP